MHIDPAAGRLLSRPELRELLPIEQTIQVPDSLTRCNLGSFTNCDTPGELIELLRTEEESLRARTGRAVFLDCERSYGESDDYILYCKRPRTEAEYETLLDEMLYQYNTWAWRTTSKVDWVAHHQANINRSFPT